MEEIWKDVKGFEGRYKVSNHGRLMSFPSKGKYKNTWHILSIKDKSGWYLSTPLCRKSPHKSVKIHILVYKTFIGDVPNGYLIHHIDGNKQNNRLDNLRKETYKEHVNYHLSINPRKCIKKKNDNINKKTSFTTNGKRVNNIDGMNYYNKYIRPKKIAQYTLDGVYISTFNNGQEASDNTGVCQRNILQVAAKTPYNAKGYTRKQAGGYIWKFAD